MSVSSVRERVKQVKGDVTKRVKLVYGRRDEPQIVAERQDAARRLKMPQYKTLRLSSRIKHPVKLPGAGKLTIRAFKVLWGSRRLFLGIVVVYGILDVVLVQGLGGGGGQVQNLKDTLTGIAHGSLGGLTSGVTIFAYLVASSGNNTSASAGVYQTLLVVIISLVVIYALRQVIAGTRLKVREAFYQGTYPLIQFVLVCFVIVLQFIPFLIGSAIYSYVVQGGIAVYPIEKFVWGLFAFCLALLSLYMATSSFFALYIVTLPNMTPMKALRSARELVRFRRWTILRKLLFLPLALIIIAGIIMLPIILWLTPLATWIFFFLSMFAIAAVHAYMYSLYRELLV